MDLLDLEKFAAINTGYTLPSGVHGICHFNLITKSLLPGCVKVNATFC